MPEDPIVADLRKEADGLVRELRKIRSFTKETIKEREEHIAKYKYMESLVAHLLQRVNELEDGVCKGNCKHARPEQPDLFRR